MTKTETKSAHHEPAIVPASVLDHRVTAIDGNGKALDRALKCPPCGLRDNVIANIKGGAYKRPEDLETDLKVLEAMPPQS